MRPTKKTRQSKERGETPKKRSKLDEKSQTEEVSQPQPTQDSNPNVRATFIEDDNYIEMDISDRIHQEFPSEDEQESEIAFPGLNNNATVNSTNSKQIQTGQSAERSDSAFRGNAKTRQQNKQDRTSSIATQDPEMMERCELLQAFMVEKGLMDPNMSNEELHRLLNASRAKANANETNDLNVDDVRPGTSNYREEVSKTPQPKNKVTAEKKKGIYTMVNSGRCLLPQESLWTLVTKLM